MKKKKPTEKKEQKPKVGAGKLCPMWHKSKKDYDRSQERQEIEQGIQDYQERQEIEQRIQNHYKKNTNQDTKLKTKHLLNTAYKLQHTLWRYHARLLEEGLKVGREQDISFIIKDIDMDRHRQFPDISSIVKLAENTLPSLYRRAEELKQKYIAIVDILKKESDSQN